MSCILNIIISTEYFSHSSWTRKHAEEAFLYSLFPLAAALPDAVKIPESQAWSRHRQLVLSPEASRWARRWTSAWWPYSTSWSLKKSLKGRFSTVISSPMPQRVWNKAHFPLVKCNKCVKKHHSQSQCGENNGGKEEERERERWLGTDRQKRREKEGEGNSTS